MQSDSTLSLHDPKDPPTPALTGRGEDPAQLARLVAQAREAVVQVDRDWVVRYCNDVYLEDLGLPREQVIGRTPFEFQPAFARSIFFETLDTARRERRSMATIGYSTILGRWLLVRVFPVDGGLLMLANDASESVLRQHQLAGQALKDPLTGLGNALALAQSIQALVARGEGFSLAVLGLDRFTSVNDAQGYARGDLALMAIASRLQIATVETESLYRLNGDEFALLTAAEPASARLRIDRLVEQARLPVVLEGESFVLGAAAGVARAPEHGTDAEELVKRALLSMRQAKRAGSARVVTYDGALETASRQRNAFEAQLRDAVEGGRFALLLQPKGSLDGRRVVGAEALIRWPHVERGLLPPDEFLPLAQDCGLMPAIDRWVLRQALTHLQALRRLGLAVPVAINLSVDSLSDSGFLDAVLDALRDTGIEPAMLDIEIPEGALMRDVAASASVLAGLDELGVGIGIDDFGTGYSSFAYLARFPVHTLKVDRSFVAGMTTNAASRTIVKSLIRLAHSLSMRVVAEGVETPAQMATLQRMRCDEMQGYGYAWPMAFDAFCDFARAQPRRRDTGAD
jgi:diguanylate cyclase (GGDEF)-like protein